MLCDICNKRKATMYYTEIINGEKREQHLCESCAAEFSSFVIKDPVTNKGMSLGNLLSGMLGNYAKGLAHKQEDDLVCSGCGMTAGEFLQRARFGCAKCYESFGSMLDNNFRAIQGADTHCGKKRHARKLASEPEKIQISKLEELGIKLQKAIELEEYEDAAHLRDEIRLIKSGACGQDKEQ